jgi:hypothetical protein
MFIFITISLFGSLDFFPFSFCYQSCKGLINFINHFKGKKFLVAGCQWVMPVILVTQEAEIKRITFERQIQQVVCETLS